MLLAQVTYAFVIRVSFTVSMRRPKLRENRGQENIANTAPPNQAKSQHVQTMGIPNDASKWETARRAVAAGNAFRSVIASHDPKSKAPAVVVSSQQSGARRERKGFAIHPITVRFSYRRFQRMAITSVRNTARDSLSFLCRIWGSDERDFESLCNSPLTRMDHGAGPDACRQAAAA